MNVKNIVHGGLRVLDVLALPAVYASAKLLRFIRANGLHKMRLSKRALMKVGVLPVTDHYYEPLFSPAHLRMPLQRERFLPGIDLNIEEQLGILDMYDFGAELSEIPVKGTNPWEFAYENGVFEAGDAEYWYCLIRMFKPGRIVEIGSGKSTLMAIRAISQNKRDDPSYSCEHICIEPFESPYLEKYGITVIRKNVEQVGLSVFTELKRNDILFIDSSHIIRPQGDVLFEYLEVLPILNSGVIVHVHDIFTPRDYPERWLIDEMKLWNEQYLLEAFLTNNREFRVIAALNYLKHNHFAALSGKCPVLKMKPDSEPGSFYLIKN